MLKRIVIAAGFVIGLIASVVGGWTAGEWYYGGASDAPASQPVADTSAPPEPASATNADRVAGNEAKNEPCGGVDPANPCFRPAPGRPLPAEPETAKKDNSAQSQDVAAELRRAWQDRTGTAAEQAEALAIYQRLAAAGN